MQLKMKLPFEDLSSNIAQAWFGYKLVGDNIDKNMKPRYQRQGDRGLSLHYCHWYAALDRIDMS